MDTSPKWSRFRVLAAFSIAVSVVLAAVVGFTVLKRSQGENSTEAMVALAVSNELAKIDVTPHGGEPLSEKAFRVRRAISAGDYKTADDISADVLNESRLGSWGFSPFSNFIARVADIADPVFEDHLNKWTDVGKYKTMSLLIRSQYYYALGWFRRGNDFGWKIQPKNANAFDENMEKALIDVNRSIQISSKNPYAFFLKLSILRGHGYSPKMKDPFEEAIRLFPEYYSLYDVMLSALQPKWHGTVASMYDFVDHYADPQNVQAPINLLYLSLYRNLLGYAANSCQSYEKDAVRQAQCVKKYMADVIRPDLEKKIIVALNLYNHLNKLEFEGVLEDIISDLIRTPGGDTYSGAVLQMAASTMKSDTQIKIKEPGQNNYIIDKEVALSWYTKGFYDNALQKYRDALTDISAAKFASKNVEDSAVAGIYKQIAKVYEKTHQYPEMIAYEKASVDLGGSNDIEHYICFGYYKLKDYNEAEKSCTATIRRDPANLYARYWRSTIYRLLQKLDAAMQDLTIVADSENELRSGAAIGMSMIYFDRNDLHGALDLLNRYNYLYDSRQTEASDVAVAYNNRCYAYMELGDLKKALEDCTNSLKYGSLPEANRKEQELLKRLGSSGISL